jgi:Serine dehydrogenase proteinase
MNAIEWGALVGLPFLLFLVFFKIWPSIRRSRIIRARQRLIHQIEMRRGSRVITMIERQKIASFCEIPLSRSLDIEGPAEVLRNIRHTLPNEPIDLIVHMTGGLPVLAEPIANALVRHNMPVTLMVPYCAMSGGTHLALASDKVLMGRNAMLGPEFHLPGSRPPLGVLEALAEVLSDGSWTHTTPLTFDMARELGMPMSHDLPEEAYRLVDLYPQVVHHPSLEQPVPMLSSSEDTHIPESEKA